VVLSSVFSLSACFHLVAYLVGLGGQKDSQLPEDPAGLLMTSKHSQSKGCQLRGTRWTPFDKVRASRKPPAPTELPKRSPASPEPTVKMLLWCFSNVCRSPNRVPNSRCGLLCPKHGVSRPRRWGAAWWGRARLGLDCHARLAVQHGRHVCPAQVVDEMVMLAWQRLYPAGICPSWSWAGSPCWSR
jgi:hypothetical protein